MTKNSTNLCAHLFERNRKEHVKSIRMETNIYKTPEAELTHRTLDEETELATRSNRFITALFDAFAIFPFTIVLLHLSGGFDAMADGTQAWYISALSVSVAAILIFLIIHGWFMIRDGQPLGKKLFKIKIVTTTGQHASLLVLTQ